MLATENLESIEETIDFAIAKGFSFMPLNVDKIPLVKWKPLQTKYPTLKQIEKWINDENTKGIGLITGKLSGVIVLDIDVKKGKNGWKYVKDKHLPLTPAVKTENGGTHFYYKYPKHVEVKTIRGLYGDESGIDVKADGGFAVMPFTPGYEWYRGLEFTRVPMADVPEWLLNDLKDRPKQNLNQPNKTRKTPTKVQKELTLKKTANPLGEEIKKYFKDEETVKKMLPLLGLEGVEIDGSPFNCILPNKTLDTRPSASLYKGKNGVIVYKDWRASKDEPSYYTLPEVYASLKYKEKRKMAGPEHATWGLRMLVEVGILKTKPIEAHELPENLRKKKAINSVYEGFKHLLAVKKLYSEDQNRTAFSYRFGSAWCGLSLRSVQNAMAQLETFEYIKRVGKEGKGTRAVNVYQLNNQKP